MWSRAARSVSGAALLAAGAAWGGLACTEKGPPAPPSSEVAAEVFNTRCAVCHGARGAGDGAVSAGLTPPPRNFQDKAWQSGVSDAHIERIIAHGGGAAGRSPLMPPSPDLVDKPVLRGLRAHIRGLTAK